MAAIDRFGHDAANRSDVRKFGLELEADCPLTANCGPKGHTVAVGRSLEHFPRPTRTDQAEQYAVY